jgi:hypothetical protein
VVEPIRLLFVNSRQIFLRRCVLEQVHRPQWGSSLGTTHRCSWCRPCRCCCCCGPRGVSCACHGADEGSTTWKWESNALFMGTTELHRQMVEQPSSQLFSYRSFTPHRHHRSACMNFCAPRRRRWFCTHLPLFTTSTTALQLVRSWE